MAADNKLELVIEVQTDKANASIKGVNQGLAGIERIAVSVAKNASEGIDGMTASMVKGSLAGNLLAEAIRGAAEWVKEYVVGAVEMAAHTERLLIGTQVLAKARGIDAAAARDQIEAVKQIGYTTEKATEIINRMLVAGQNLERSKSLAKVAKDLYAAGIGVDPAETVEKMLLAVETGQSRGLKSLGLYVNLTEKQEIASLKAGHALSEEEKSTVAFNAIMKKASVALGTTAAAAENAETKQYNLGLAMTELKEKIGTEFQPEYKRFIDAMMDGVKWAKENTDALKMVAEVIALLAGALAAAALAVKIAGIAAAVNGFVIALATNPFALVAIGAIAAGVAVYQMHKNLEDANDALAEQIKLQRTQKAIQSGMTVEQMKAAGIDEKDIRNAARGGRAAIPGQEEWKAPKDDLGITVTGVPDRPAQAPASTEEDDARVKERLLFAQEVQKKQVEVSREAHQALLSTIGDTMGPIMKAEMEVQKLQERLSTITDKNGKEHQIALPADAQRDLTLDKMMKMGKAVREEWQKYGEYLDKQWEEEQQRISQRFEYEAKYANDRLEDSKKLYGFEEERAGFERDAAMRQLEASDAQTLPQKLAVEQRKAEIEIEYATKSHQVKMTLFDMESREVLARVEMEARAAHLTDEQIAKKVAEVAGDRQLMAGEMNEAFGARTDAAQENAAIAQANLVRDQYRSIFQSLKEQAAGVFDALLTKGQSVFSALGNSLKTAFLTAIKDVVTSRVAGMLTEMITGQKVSFAPGGGSGSGPLGALSGVLGLGASPVFGSGGAVAAPAGAGGGFGSVLNNPLILSAAGSSVLAGGTGGAGALAAGSGVAGSAVGGAGAAGGTIASKAGLAGMYGNLKTSLAGFGNIGKAFSTAHGGVNGAAGGAALAGGGLLAMNGLQRGGLLGMGETAAGGALIGAKFGGPVGAAIGAGAGLAAGLIRLFVKSASEKARAKIKAAYSVDISDKAVLADIVNTAKQAYGGDLDMAIRSKDIVDKIQLYALAHGQTPKGMPGQVAAVSLAERGGSLYQVPGYSNGSPATSPGGLLPSMGLDRIGAGMASGGGAMVIHLDGPATTALLNGVAVKAVASNPRTVQAATLAATKANAGRRQMTALQMSPGTITT